METKNQLPEAPVSVNTKIKSPNGFEYQLTLRNGVTEKDFADLMTLIAEKELTLLAKKWTPLPYSNSYQKQQKPVDYVPDRKCPTCGSRLVRSETRDGKKMIKCETNKWNAQLKKAEGCPFIEWEQPQGGNY